jgi:GNAT superfamily N-acetyltransferase
VILPRFEGLLACGPVPTQRRCVISITLPDGYHPVPRGKLANVQTFLEMRRKPPLRPVSAEASWRIERFDGTDLHRYRTLFHLVGDEYLWAGRLLMPETELRAFLRDPRVEVYVLVTDRGDEGLLDLDFRIDRECEISLFGVAPALIKSRAGRYLMNHALETAWSHPIERFWLHTCTLDHPNALAFYRRTGFVPYERKVEVYDDPRSLKLTRSDAAPLVPIL